MTTERTKIMELLEPYMDKTLSFGCYIKLYDAYFKYKSSIIQSVDTDEQMILLVDNSKIIGHYSIDAVLKYFQDYRNGYDNGITREYLYIFLEDPVWGQVKIPNKPLQTYTNQEDKELLELLLSIK